MTGVGNRSKGGAKIKPAVIKFLKQQQIRHHSPNGEGYILVYNPGKIN